MNTAEILAHCDHTLLKPTAVWDDIKTICDEGIEFSTASVCIPPSFVAQAAEYTAGRVGICTVIGFPNGYSTVLSKAFEAGDAVKNGADEIDMVINVGRLRDGDYAYVLNEIKAVKESCGDKLLKVIIETCLLTDDEKIRACELITEAHADFVKTSTGFSSGGATLADVKLLKSSVGRNVRVKAAGGITGLDDAELFIAAGASRLGTSRLVAAARAAMNGEKK